MKVRAERVLRRLLNGNRRFAASRLQHPHRDVKRCIECAAGQTPVAAVLGCADSRVPPEIIFDCGIGDLFVVRVTGAVFDTAIIASLEYAVKHLNVPLIIVMGHTSCGAVTAAVNGVQDPGTLGELLNEIEIECRSFTSSGMSIDTVIKRYTVRIASRLATIQPVLQEAVEKAECTIIPVYYSFTTGIVEML